LKTFEPRTASGAICGAIQKVSGAKKGAERNATKGPTP
jgi:hypothetical protein